MQTTFKLKILPLFIGCSILMLSVKINNIFDLLKNPNTTRFSISSSEAVSQEMPSSTIPETTQPAKNNSPEPQDSFTKAEIEILQDLASRRELLEEKSKEIDKRAFQLQLAQEEIDKKINQMKEYEQKLSALVIKYNQQEQEKIAGLVKMYSAMKPKDAARIFDTLDMDILITLLKEMKPSTSSAIVSQMRPDIARSVTTELIGNNIVKKK